MLGTLQLLLNTRMGMLAGARAASGKQASEEGASGEHLLQADHGI